MSDNATERAKKPRHKKPKAPKPDAETPRPPRDLGRDGVTNMVDADRALRAREVSKPTEADHTLAAQVVQRMLTRAQGRR